MPSLSKNAIARLLVELGELRADHLDKAIVNLTSKRIHCDEIPSFCCAKEEHVPADLRASLVLATFGLGSLPSILFFFYAFRCVGKRSKKTVEFAS
jgi:hypothetical protein